MPEFRHAPGDSRRRGLPAIGFRIRIPDGVEIVPPANDQLLTAVERASDGHAVGEVDVEIVPAALIVDRDGQLERAATDAADEVIASARDGRLTAFTPVDLGGGGTGFRAEVELRGDACPHVTILALAGADLAVSGALLVTVRSARRDWPAGDAVLESLEILTRPGANDADRPLLPLVTGGGGARAGRGRR